MQLRALNVGCFGGGTGLPSLLGGLKQNPWLRVNAVVTMFDSGGSSGQLRDQLGVLPRATCSSVRSRSRETSRRLVGSCCRGCPRSSMTGSADTPAGISCCR